MKTLKKDWEIGIIILILIGLMGCFGSSGDDGSDGGTTPENQVVAPVCSPSADEYNTSQEIELFSSTEGSTIYYTLDGFNPAVDNLNTIEYTDPNNGSFWLDPEDDPMKYFDIDGYITVKAVAVKDGMVDSDIVSFEFRISDEVIMFYSLTISAANGSVTKSPDQNTYESGTSVTIEAVPDTGYVFQSWSDDITGTENPKTITVSYNMEITANFVEEGQMEQVETPVISPASGEYLPGTQVTISTNTTGATIKYKVNDEEYWATYYSDTSYDLKLDGNTTVSVIAEADGMLTSEAATATYIVKDGNTTASAIELTVNELLEGEAGYSGVSVPFWVYFDSIAENRYEVVLYTDTDEYDSDFMITGYKSDASTEIFDQYGLKEVLLTSDERIYMQVKKDGYSSSGKFGIKVTRDDSFVYGTWEKVGNTAINGDGWTGRYDFISDSQGNMYAAYRKPTIVKYDSSGETWEEMGTSLPGSDGGYNLGIDENDDLYLAYPSVDSFDSLYDTGQIRVYKYDGTEWQAIGTPYYSKALEDCRFAVSQAGVPYILSTATDGVVSVKKYDGIAWQELIDTEIDMYYIGDLEVSGENVYISYHTEQDMENTSHGLTKFGYYDGASWNTIDVGSFYTAGSIKIDNEKVYLALDKMIYKLNSGTLEEYLNLSDLDNNIRGIEFDSGSLYISTGSEVYRYNTSLERLGKLEGRQHYGEIEIIGADIYSPKIISTENKALGVYKFVE